MKKMTPKGQMLATCMLIIFVGVMLTVMTYGAKAGHDLKMHQKEVIQDVGDNNTDAPEIMEPLSVQPVQTIVLSSIVNPDNAAPRFKEVIVCQIINGVKHFSNQFEEVV